MHSRAKLFRKKGIFFKKCPNNILRERPTKRPSRPPEITPPKHYIHITLPDWRWRHRDDTRNDVEEHLDAHRMLGCDHGDHLRGDTPVCVCSSRSTYTNDTHATRDIG